MIRNSALALLLLSEIFPLACDNGLIDSNAYEARSQGLSDLGIAIHTNPIT